MMLLLVLLSFLACCAADLQPQAWPPQFRASLTRNGTAADGSSTGVDIEMKWYDYSQPAEPLYKQECSMNGVTSTFLLRGQDGWIFNAVSKACRYLQLGVFVVKPDWMQGGEYQGQETVNNVLSNKVSTSGLY
jgi:hypothetical protein